jgi:hypothetical protein
VFGVRDPRGGQGGDRRLRRRLPPPASLGARLPHSEGGEEDSEATTNSSGLNVGCPGQWYTFSRIRRLGSRLTYANVMATVAVFISLGGASYAAFKLPKNSVGSKQLQKNAVSTAKIKNEAVTGAKIKKGSLTGNQINTSTLGTVPSATSANVANSLAAAEAWHEVGAPGEPPFLAKWSNSTVANDESVAFYKDHDGIVHLRGIATAETGAPGNIFQLPPGFRPPIGKIGRFLIGCTGVICPTKTGELLIYGSGHGAPDGVVFVEAGTTEANLDGITFRAES